MGRQSASHLKHQLSLVQYALSKLALKDFVVSPNKFDEPPQSDPKSSVSVYNTQKRYKSGD